MVGRDCAIAINQRYAENNYKCNPFSRSKVSGNTNHDFAFFVFDCIKIPELLCPLVLQTLYLTSINERIVKE